MKKNYFIVLFAMLTFALNNYAQDDASQDDTYNMVVKLPDGTTFTINTGYVDEVSFSNGKVTVSGQALTDLLQRISQQNGRIDSLCVVTDENYEKFKSLESMVYYREDIIGQLNSIVYYHDATIGQLNDSISTLKHIVFDHYYEQIAENSELKVLYNMLYCDSYDRISVLRDENEVLKNMMAELSTRNATLETSMAALSARLATLEVRVAELLEAKVKEEQQNTTTTNP